MSDRLRVATYNVHRCVGTDGRTDPRRIAEVIEGLDADLVGLQEIDSRLHAGGEEMQLELLGRLTGMTAIAGPTLVIGRGRYGNGALSRRPIDTVVTHDLSVRGREPRGALELAVSVDDQRLRLVVTHLGLRPGERRRQVIRLLPILEGPVPLVLVGDLNEHDSLFSLRALRRWFGRSPKPRTFPSRLPLLALDRIFVRPRTALVSLGVHASRLARSASDHLPLVATLAVGTAGPVAPEVGRAGAAEGRRREALAAGG